MFKSKISKSTEKSSRQFQEAGGKKIVLPAIKKSDAKELFCLLKPILQAKIFLAGEGGMADLTITDIGCGEGRMLFTVLKLLKENLDDYFKLKIQIYGCEPVEALREKFVKRLDPKKNPSKIHPHLKNVVDVNIAGCGTEKYIPPQSDIFLFSHSLYYSQLLWNSKRYSSVKFNNHLLTKFLKKLNENGQLVVILQSSASSDIPREGGKSISNHEDFENVMYPIKTTIEEGKSIPSQQRKTYTNAEIFETCLKRYMLQWYQEHNTKLSYSVRRSLILIPLGEINYDRFNYANERYEQSQSVQLLLNFYTRGLFLKYDQAQQRKILTFIKENCIQENKGAVMCHVNKVFVLAKKEIIPTPVRAFDSNPSEELKTAL